MRKSPIFEIEIIKYHCMSVAQCNEKVSFVTMWLHSVFTI